MASVSSFGESVSARLGNIIASVDQLGNSIGGGNRDTTISGRAYYNYAKKNGWFWVIFMKCIDFSFYGLDGEDHCMQAYDNDRGEVYHDASLLDKLILLLFSIPVCIIVACGGYPLMLFKMIRG